MPWSIDWVAALIIAGGICFLAGFAATFGSGRGTSYLFAGVGGTAVCFGVGAFLAWREMQFGAGSGRQ